MWASVAMGIAPFVRLPEDCAQCAKSSKLEAKPCPVLEEPYSGLYCERSLFAVPAVDNTSSSTTFCWDPQQQLQDCFT